MKLPYRIIDVHDFAINTIAYNNHPKIPKLT